MTVDISLKRFSSDTPRPRHELNVIERATAREALAIGRITDKSYLKNPGEWSVRRAGRYEFRGTMVACGYLDVPLDFPKWPQAVVIARRTGCRIERRFSTVQASVFAENASQHVLGAYSPEDWWTVCSVGLGVVAFDEFDSGGVQ